MTPGCYYQTAIKLGIIQRVTSKLNVTQVAMTVKKFMQKGEGKKFIPNKKRDIGMEVYHLTKYLCHSHHCCSPN